MFLVVKLGLFVCDVVVGWEDWDILFLFLDVYGRKYIFLFGSKGFDFYIEFGDVLNWCIVLICFIWFFDSVCFVDGLLKNL